MSSNFTDHEEDLLEIEKLRESAQQINLDDSFGDEEGEEEEDYSDELDEGIIESASKGHLTMSPTNQTASQSRIDEGQNILDNLSNVGDSTLNFNSSMPKKDHPKKVEAVTEDKEDIGHCSSDMGGNISPIKPSGPPISTVENKATIQRPGQRGPPTRGRPGPPGLTRPGAPVKRPVMMPKRVSDSQIDDGQPQDDVIGGISNQGDKDNQEDTSSNISEIRQRANDDTVNSQFDLLRNLTDDLKTADERRIEGRTAVDRIDEDDDEHTLEGRDTDRSKKDKIKSIADHIKKETMMQDSADIFNEKDLKFRNTKEDDSINLSPSKQGQILDGLDIEDKFEKIKGSDVGRLRDMEQFGEFSKQISIIPKYSEDSADYSPEIDNRRELRNMNQDNEKQNKSDIWGNKINDANDPAENEEPQSKLSITDLNISDSAELHTINPVSKGNSKFAPSKQKLPLQKKTPVTMPPVRARVPPMPKKTEVEDVEVSEVIREAEAPLENKDLPIHDFPEAKLFVPSGLSPDDYKFDESPTVNLNRDSSPSNLFSSPERADSRASPNLSQPKGNLRLPFSTNMSGRLNNSNQVVEDSVIINTNVNNIVKNDQDLGLFQLIETLLIENKSLKLQNQSLKEELNGVMGKLEHAEVMKRRLEHVESSLADRERELEARDDQIRESKARGQMADDASDSFKHGVKMIEDNYDSSLRDCLDQIEQHRRQMSLISEKQERRARDVQTSASKNKGDLIAKLTSLTSSLTANDTEGVPTDDVRSIIDEMQRQVAKEYVFDEKIIVDNTVIVDPEVIKLTKKIENLYSSRYEGLPKELRAASHLSGNSDGQSKLLIEDLSGIVIQSENNKRKYVEEMNSLLTEINMSLNNEQDDQLNLESLFPSVIIPNIQEFSIMSPNPQRKFSESQSGFGAGGLISRMKREGRLQDAQGLASINPSGKDLDPSYSDVQPSPLLPTKGVKSIAANRFGDHRRIRVPDSENESEDASSRLLPVESIPIIGGSPHGIRGAKPMLLTGKRSSTRGDLNDKYQLKANNRKHHSQTSIKITDDPARLENTLFHENNEISENEMESQSSASKFPQCMQSPYAGDEYSTNNPFDEYEPKQMMGRDNLSYASNMATPRSLALSSPMNIQTQRRFDKRNIPVSFSNMVKPQDKLNKYNMKTKEETEVIASTPVREGRNRRDPMANMKIDLNFNEDVEPEQTFEKKDVYFSSPTDISKKGQRSQLYLIPENPDQEPQDQNEDGAQKNNINLMSSQPEKEEIGESSDEGEKHATNADLKRNSIQIKSEDEFSLKNQDESKEKRKNDDKKIQREDSPHKEISSTHDINSNKVDTAKKNIHEPKKESSVLQVPTKYEEDYQNIDDSKFEEHHVDVKNDFKGVELPKKLPPKQSTSQQPSVKKQLFKARPKFINFTETKQEKTDLVGFDNTEQMPSESHQPIDDDGEDKNENTVNKMHANLITSDDSPKDHQGSARKKSSDDNIDIDIGWGFPQKKDTIEDNEDEEIEHIQSPDFGMSAKTRKIHLEKRLTFGEKELREATEEKDSEAKPEVSKTELTGKRLFGKPTLKPSLPTDEIKKEESSDRIQSSTLRSETDSKLVSSPEQQNSPKKGEKKPLKKIFKQTKLVKKT